MKAIGVIRKMDDLGRIVIPKELRAYLDMNKKDPIAIYADRDSVILRKYQPECIFCGGTTNVQEYKGKSVCSNCMEGIIDAVDKH